MTKDASKALARAMAKEPNANRPALLLLMARDPVFAQEFCQARAEEVEKKIKAARFKFQGES